MSESIFKKACRLVDEAIAADGIPVSAEERNRRVQATEFRLKEGVPIDKIDPRARLSTVRFNINTSGELEQHAPVGEGSAESPALNSPAQTSPPGSAAPQCPQTTTCGLCNTDCTSWDGTAWVCSCGRTRVLATGAEVERLSQLLKVQESAGAIHAADVVRLEAEVKRLRKALGIVISSLHTTTAMRDYCRRALGGDDDTAS